MVQHSRMNHVLDDDRGLGDVRPEINRRSIVCPGLRSLLSILLAPLGRIGAIYYRRLCDPRRFENGLIIIIPGIEGCSSINDSIARGLCSAGLSHAIHIINWCRFRPWNPLYLAMQRHNQDQAKKIARLISEYQYDFPGRPVHLIGHSAGAGIALFVLENLREDQAVTSVTLLAAAVSREFGVASLLGRTRAGIWNFYSPLDLPTVGLGTIIFGTMDRRHSISAGALGFRNGTNQNSCVSSDGASEPRLHQICYDMSMAKLWNFGGHFGFTNAVFVRNVIAPICQRR